MNREKAGHLSSLGWRVVMRVRVGIVRVRVIVLVGMLVCVLSVVPVRVVMMVVIMFVIVLMIKPVFAVRIWRFLHLGLVSR